MSLLGVALATLVGAENLFAKKAEAAAKDPSPSTALEFGVDKGLFLIAGMTVAQFVATAQETRDAINKIMNRQVDEIC